MPGAGTTICDECRGDGFIRKMSGKKDCEACDGTGRRPKTDAEREHEARVWRNRYQTK